MLEDMKLFWEFFFFPLMNLEELPLFLNVCSTVLMCLCVTVFIREVYRCFL